MRHKKIKDNVVTILEDIILYIKRDRKRKNMPFKEIKTIMGILFPKTKSYNEKNEKKLKGFYKHVFVIYSKNGKLTLKIGRSNKDIRKDHTTYTQLCKRLGENKANRCFAKIYWRHGLFMLQKYGKKVEVPDKEIERLKEITGLKDVRKANIMKFDSKFKIVDAERK